MKPSIFQRFAAYTIDFMVAYACVWTSAHAFSVGISDVFQFPIALKYSILKSSKEMVGPLFFWAFFCYLFFSNYFRQGRSLGCICLNFTVLSKQRSELTFKESLVRSGLQTLAPIALASVIYAPLLLIPLIRKDGRGVVDLFSNSRGFLDQYLGPPTLVVPSESITESPTTIEEQQRAA